jgi:hypothetical protein
MITRKFETGDTYVLRAKRGETIAGGAAVGEGGCGEVRELRPGDVFRGFAADGVMGGTNIAGGYVTVRHRGAVVLDVKGADIGQPVHAQGPDTFSCDGKGSVVGWVSNIVSGGAIVKFDA